MTKSMSLSRRDLLRQAAAAGFAMPYLVPRRVLGIEGTAGANAQIVLGFIGMGIRGTQLVKNIPAQGRIAAICDADGRKLATAMQTFQADWDTYDDYRRMLDRKDIDAVVIATPHHQHVLPAMLACQAGMDVYLEKPLSLYVAEGRALVSAARKYNRVVQIGSQQRTMEMDRFACELVRDGGIGKLKRIEAINYPGPHTYPKEGFPEESVPKGMNWDLWQGQAPQHPFNVRLAMKELGGGWILWRAYSGYAGTDMGAHTLDMIQYAMGADQSGPVEFWPVAGEGASARIDYRYADGTEVHLSIPAGSPGPALGAIFIGQQCKIEINRNKFTTNPPDFVTDPPDARLAERWEGDGFVAKGHVENWMDCIESRARPNADVEIGHRTVTVTHLINITREVNRRIHWDPVKEQIIDDAEASALLDRPRRKGWELPVV